MQINVTPINKGMVYLTFRNEEDEYETVNVNLILTPHEAQVLYEDLSHAVEDYHRSRGVA